MHFCRQPPPRPRLHEGYPCSSAGGPHPTRAFAGVPILFCRHPPSSRAFAGGYPYASPAPPPRPRLRRSSPAPAAGAGSVRGDIRGAAVSGSSPGSPHAVDRGDIATGGGADGEGELVPPPLSLTLPRPHISPPPHPCLRRQATHTLLPASPTPPAPAALLPRPQEGAGAVRGDIRGATVPGSSPGSPHAVDRGDIAAGGGGPRGGGTRSPSPVSHTPTTLLLAGRLPVLLSPSPTPPAWVRAIPMMVRDEPCPRELLASIPGKDRE